MVSPPSASPAEERQRAGVVEGAAGRLRDEENTRDAVALT